MEREPPRITIALNAFGGLSVVSAILFLGASFYVSNEIGRAFCLGAFFSGLLGWLSERADLISIAPKNPEHIRLNLTEEELSSVTRLVWGEIIFFVALGIFVWLRRRS